MKLYSFMVSVFAVWSLLVCACVCNSLEAVCFEPNMGLACAYIG